MNTFLHSHLTDKILGCAIAVHRELGPGLSEYSYQTALALEMAAKPLQFVQERPLTVRFRDTVVGWHRPDFIVEGLVIVELKAVARLAPVFTKQVLSCELKTHRTNHEHLTTFFPSKDRQPSCDG